MQIAYLNINGCFGCQRKGNRNQSNSVIAEKIIDKLFCNIEPDILFLLSLTSIRQPENISLLHLKKKVILQFIPITEQI
ncbi:unknown [Clostridium sp. CAG:964]|nr:unknown [Clostridium sp. CAG:964]